jgi:hypothetical protein
MTEYQLNSAKVHNSSAQIRLPCRFPDSELRLSRRIGAIEFDAPVNHSSRLLQSTAFQTV